jgi:hypothetical protein
MTNENEEELLPIPQINFIAIRLFKERFTCVGLVCGAILRVPKLECGVLLPKRRA